MIFLQKRKQRFRQKWKQAITETPYTVGIWILPNLVAKISYKQRSINQPGKLFVHIDHKNPQDVKISLDDIILGQTATKLFPSTVNYMGAGASISTR